MEKTIYGFGDSFGEYEFELYQAASGDWCVTVTTYNKHESYNLGSREQALEFILSYAVIRNDE